MNPRCPHCESRNVEPYQARLEASDRSDSVDATHRCLECKTPFRHTPGTHVRLRATAA